jgi:hypothetical protein
MYAPSNVYGPSRTSIPHTHHSSGSLPFPATAHVKSVASDSEKSHAPNSTRYYYYTITDTTPSRFSCSCFHSTFIEAPLIEILVATLQTIFCFLYIITGQAILHAAHHSGYNVSVSSSVKVGAVGGVAMTFPAILLCVYRREGIVFTLWSIAVDVLIGAMAGPIGVAILQSRLHEQILDSPHAARAGALGAVIISSSLHLLKKI